MDTNSIYSVNDLILQVSEGDHEAFRQLFDRYRNKIFSISWRIIGVESDAEDVVQEVFIKLWSKKESLREVENFEAYLNTMVKNHIFNCLRKLANEKSLYQRLRVKPVRQNNDSLDKVCYHELESLVQKTVDLLPPQQKKVYNFSRIDGLKHEEIAKKMGISKSTVKGHITEALGHIKSVLSSIYASIIFLILITLFSIF